MFRKIPLVHTKHPGKNYSLAMWPLGNGGGGKAGIPARCSTERVEEGVERCPGFTYD
jgi:hypothetical protein